MGEFSNGKHNDCLDQPNEKSRPSFMECCSGLGDFVYTFQPGVEQNSIFHTTEIDVQSTLVISNSKGLSEILRDIHTSTYQICRIEEQIILITTFNKYICNWTHEV